MDRRRRASTGASRYVRDAAMLLFTLAMLATIATADIQSAQQKWKDLQAQESALLAPRRHREVEVAMTALGAVPSGAASDAALVEAEKRLQALDEALRRVRSQFGDLLRLRAETRDAGAPVADPKNWKSAENILLAAAQKLETGRVDPARRQAPEAKPFYEAARYTAWRATMLQGTDSLIARLEAQKAQSYVPRSMVRALDARSAAEKRLSERGQLNAEVRAAGDRAASEARHARYLFDRIHAACGDKAPDRLEGAVLDWEESVQRTLVAMGLQGNVEAGLSPPLETIEKEAARLRGERDRLRVDTTKRAGAADSLRETSQDLREQLQDLGLQLAELRRLQAEPEELARIQGMFRRDEGRVLIDGRDLILRLHGLQFPSGQAQLSADAEPLLDKIVNLLEPMPNARLVVEGHTDAAGKPEANQLLSQQRADAVRDALIQKAHLEPGRITSIGYGSSRPVASNDAEEGRALNRRIEIIVMRSQ